MPTGAGSPPHLHARAQRAVRPAGGNGAMNPALEAAGWAGEAMRLVLLSPCRPLPRHLPKELAKNRSKLNDGQADQASLSAV